MFRDCFGRLNYGDIIMSNKAGSKQFDEKLRNSTEERIHEALTDKTELQFDWQDVGEPDLKTFHHSDDKMPDEVFLEVEIKKGWDGGEFPFNTIHIPGRKFKYLTWQPLKYVVFSKNLEKCLVVDSGEICKKSWFTIKDTYYSSDEVFFTIPFDKDTHLYKTKNLEDCFGVDTTYGNGGKT